jgi:hypothetical protein
LLEGLTIVVTEDMLVVLVIVVTVELTDCPGGSGVVIVDEVVVGKVHPVVVFGSSVVCAGFPVEEGYSGVVK